ncbi:MAG: M1 family metallopeptidase [Thermomicrobiales bacterium]|nr:M1 family metallopeptidase [Thermomicrobiales bacterium]
MPSVVSGLQGRVIPFVLLCVTLVLAGLIPPMVGLASTPVATQAEESAGSVLPEYQDVLAERSDSIARYRFDLTLDPIMSTIGGQMAVTWVNDTGRTQSALPFRIYPNAWYYRPGGMTIEGIRVERIIVSPRFDETNTVLFVDLPAPVAPGKSVTVAIDFMTTVPEDSDGSYGILNHDLELDRFVLTDWYPIVAGWDETGWRLEPPTDQGDPTFAATADYIVRLALPASYAVVGTGVETRQADGSVLIETGPARELAIVAGSGFEELTTQVGDITISFFVEPANVPMAQHLLDLAAEALAFYERELGPYPFTELDFVSVPLSLAYGVSWSGVLFIANDLLRLSPDNAAAADFTVLHELGHQWWGGMVGANSNDHTWMVEGLTNTTALLAQVELQGASAATQSLHGWVVTPYLNLLYGTGDAVADVSIFDQSLTAPLSTLAYGKGALGFLAIRDAIGHEAFMSALAAYAGEFQLGIADPEDLLAAFENASGMDLEQLWSFWFEEANTTPEDVQTLVDAVVASFAA